MKRIAICALALALAACTPEPETGTEAGASEGAIPEAHVAPLRFLFDLYSHYDGKQDFSPLGDAAPLYFDDELLALIREDDRLRDGEIGALDHDPICQCQDYDRLQVQIRAENVTDTRARAIALVWDVRPGPRNGRMPVEITYELVRQDGDWRIHDLSSAAMKSLRAHLKASNAKLAVKPSGRP